MLGSLFETLRRAGAETGNSPFFPLLTQSMYVMKIILKTEIG